MFFTQDDYKKIQQWLIKNSVKDTEFNEANIPFNGEETITIVQGNQNKKVFLKDLIAQVFNLGISDFVNITDKYDAPNISLEEAIRLIPSRARKEGQVITFLDMEDHWHIYQFKGVLNQWNVLDTWEDLFDWEKLIINSILPDEEDLTKSLPDENGNSYLSLKDREYNPEDFSGLGRVILRKNIVEIEDPIYGKVKKNVLYQDMFTQSNTIYEIRYDFDLNGAEITIPEGCILDFQGGSFSNGSLNAPNYVNIIANYNIFKEIKLVEYSNFVKDTINPTWFGVKGDRVTDDTDAINYMLSFVKNIKIEDANFRNETDNTPTIVLNSKDGYLTSSPITIDFKCNIVGGGTFFYNGENIENSGVIILNNQYNTIFEFSICRIISKVIDLSDGIKMAALKTMNCVWCTFKIHQIHGFYRGVFMDCASIYQSTWQCNFDIHFISFCIDAIVVNTVNLGFSNGNIIKNVIFLGQTSGLILPSNLSNGSFLKFIGDGSYGANSWIIENIQCEKKLNSSVSIHFIRIDLDSPSTFRDFSIKDVRLEEIGYYIMVSNGKHSNWNFSHFLYSTTFNVWLTNYNLDCVISNRILESFGITLLGNSAPLYSRNLDSAIKEHYYCGRYYDLSDNSRLLGLQHNVVQADGITTFGMPGETYELLPNQSISISKKASNRIYLIFSDPDGNRINFPKNDILFDELLGYVASREGYKDYLQTSANNVNQIWISNKGTNSYQVGIILVDDYEMRSNLEIKKITNTPTIKVKGTTEERPTIAASGASYEYFDTTLGKPIYWTGEKWVDATGANV